MSTEKLIARAWANHAATTVGVERAGEFVALAECSGHGRMSSEDEVIARRMAACWNACKGVDTEMLEQLGPLVAATLPYHTLKAQYAELLAKLAEVNAWIVCAAIATPEDMMQNAAHIEAITRAAA